VFILGFESEKTFFFGKNLAHLRHVTKAKITKTSTLSNSNDGREFGGSIYQRCNDRLETGVQLSWASGSNATKFGIAAKYDLDKDAAVRCKVNNVSQIGLGYQQKLRDGEFLLCHNFPSFSGITLTLSTLIDGKNFNAGGHKIGVALELEA
jgi:voltage-dependent anion channel protein 2